MKKHDDLQERRKYWNKFIESLEIEGADGDSFRLMSEMRRISHAIRQIGESSLAEAGMSMAQYRLLMHLLFAKNVMNQAESNPSEISEHLGVSRNTISSLIRSLEDKDLIERKLDTKDRRKFKISLTPAGIALVKQYAGHHMNIVSTCFDALDQEERQQFSNVLDKLNNQIDVARACVKENKANS